MPSKVRILDPPRPGERPVTWQNRSQGRSCHVRLCTAGASRIRLSAVGHRHTPPGQQISDLDHRQILADPLADLLALSLQRLPGLAVPARPGRPHGRHHLADHLVGQLRHTTLTNHPGRLGGGHIAAGGLAVHPRLLRHRAQSRTTQPRPQHLTHLSH